jgi:hypothetical protein
VTCSDSSIFVYALVFIFVAILLVVLAVLIRRKLKRNRKYLGAWKQFIMVLKINIDFMQINSALPSVLAITWPENFLSFLKIFNFVNVDFMSITGATCLDGVNYMSRFATMSFLPACAIAIGLAEWIRGKAVAKAKLAKEGGHKKELVKVAHEMFLMVDEDHSGSVDKKEYTTLIRNFSTNPSEDVEPMNQEQFTKRIIETQDHKKVLNWWWNQSNFSHSLNTTVQMLLLVHTPVTRMVFQYFNCNPIHERSFLKSDYSIECFAPEWNGFLVYVLLIGGAFTVGFPFAMAVYIRWHRKELYTAKIQSRIGFLYNSYTKKAEFWEVHEIIRKTLLTGVIIYLQARPTIQAIVAVIICLLACCTLNYFEPQKNRVVFWLAQLSFIITSLKFSSAVVLIAAKNSEERESIGSLLIAFDAVFFIGSILGTVIAIYILWDKIKEIKKRTAKIVPTTPPPPPPTTSNQQLLKGVRVKYGASSKEYKEALSGMSVK